MSFASQVNVSIIYVNTKCYDFDYLSNRFSIVTSCATYAFSTLPSCRFLYVQCSLYITTFSLQYPGFMNFQVYFSVCNDILYTVYSFMSVLPNICIYSKISGPYHSLNDCNRIQVQPNLNYLKFIRSTVFEFSSYIYRIFTSYLEVRTSRCAPSLHQTHLYFQ